MSRRVWKSGDPCRIGVRGDRGIIERRLAGFVHLVSSEGQPLAVGGFDGVVDGFVGWLPLIWRGGVANTFAGTPVVVTDPDADDDDGAW